MLGRSLLATSILLSMSGAALALPEFPVWP